MTHPLRRADQSFADHQAEMAAWMGCTVSEMNKAHDGVHWAVERLSGYTSHAMRQAVGTPLTPDEQALADIEEDACLALQRYLHHAEKAK